MKDIDTIINSGLCIGCGICTSIAGKDSFMAESHDGFLYPIIKKYDCDLLNTVLKICPGIQCGIENTIKTVNGKIWGPIKYSAIGYAKNKVVRWYGSSGGGITSILLYLLEKKYIDAVVQIGPSKTNPTRTETFFSRTKEDILHCTSSRYCPSSPLSKIVSVLNEPNIKIAFVGRPCDASALRKYLNLNRHLIPKVVLIISFFCASTPSYKATDALLNRLGVNKEEISDFWYRGRGWPGFATAVTKAGEEQKLSYMESWGEILSKYAHFRCKICPDGIGCSADISFADGWETFNGQPVFKEKDGQNLIIARTINGANILNNAMKAGYLHLSDFKISELPKIQPSQYEKRRIVGARLLALRFSGLFFPKFTGISVYSNLFGVNPQNLIVNFFGTLRRRLIKN